MTGVIGFVVALSSAALVIAGYAVGITAPEQQLISAR
jgi:hypothetical protein